jgi:excisionase family DNA binding protein
MNSQRLTLTVEEAARVIGCSRGLAYAAARRGELPTVRLGRKLLVPKHALYAWLGITDFSLANGDGEKGDTVAVPEKNGGPGAVPGAVTKSLTNP